MSISECFMERIVDDLVGIAFLIIGFFFLAMGVSFLPVIGILLAIPIFIISISFFGAPPGKACYGARVGDK